MEQVTIVECPRDAWQGLPGFVPTVVKSAYLLALVEAGFRHIDAVSFVSPKHVPQMQDSEEVLAAFARRAAGMTTAGLDIIGIVLNEKGLDRALAAPGVTTIGYPYSVSDEFRRANSNMSLEESRALVENLRRRTTEAGRELVVYVSMAFGNPYHEIWGPDVTIDAVNWLKSVGVTKVSLADTVGLASPQLVGDVFAAVRECVPGVELGSHLHGRPEAAADKVLVAYEAGCRRFDSALTGLGGCPFAGDALVGNIPTETVIETLESRGAATGIDRGKLPGVLASSNRIREECGG
jgi:hydroxymethylglutaryl-CoA lyase